MVCIYLINSYVHFVYCQKNIPSYEKGSLQAYVESKGQDQLLHTHYDQGLLSVNRIISSPEHEAHGELFWSVNVRPAA